MTIKQGKKILGTKDIYRQIEQEVLKLGEGDGEDGREYMFSLTPEQSVLFREELLIKVPNTKVICGGSVSEGDFIKYDIGYDSIIINFKD